MRNSLYDNVNNEQFYENANSSVTDPLTGNINSNRIYPSKMSEDFVLKVKTRSQEEMRFNAQQKEPSEPHSSDIDALSNSPSQASSRERWDNRFDFLLSVIGYAVDLSNMYRFPYQCYKHGGGAFLVPYFLMSILCAVPMLYMELLLGQYHQRGPVKLWQICPLMTGIGITQVIIAYLVSHFYIILIAYSFYLFFDTFRSELPWDSCNFSGATHYCATAKSNFSNQTDYVLSSNEYFERHILRVQDSRGLDDLGPIQWPLIGYVMMTVILIFICLMKGVKGSGKVVYVTALFPYVLLFALLINVLYLPGAVDGIYLLFYPEYERLKELDVWYAAAVQIFFSTGAGFGVHISLSSYCHRKHNFYVDCITTSIVNSLTSLLAGTVVFAYLGNLARVLQKNVTDVLSSGPTLIFQLYPFAISTMKGSIFWSFLFFLLLICLGVDSQMGGLEAVFTALNDVTPHKLLKKKHWRKTIVGIVLFTAFCVSLLNTTSGGIITLIIMDNCIAGPTFLMAVLFQAISISWIYGMENFCNDVKSCLGHFPGIYWRLCWKFFTPAILFALTLHNLLQPFENYYVFQSHYPEWANFSRYIAANKTYMFPEQAIYMMWFYIIIEFIPIPVMAIYFIWKYRKNLWLAISPTSEHNSILTTGNCVRTKLRHYLSLGPQDSQTLSVLPD